MVNTLPSMKIQEMTICYDLFETRIKANIYNESLCQRRGGEGVVYLNVW